MKQKRPLIFISNDDGYLAGGINQLIQMVRPLGRVLVIAPDSARSGSSMAITSDRPISFKKIREEEDLEVYSCSGTPVDCVKLAFYSFFEKEKPDLILSGINHGDNASINVHYSGTMGIVLEGCLKKIPSIGFSSCSIEKEADFSSLQRYIVSLCDLILKKGLPEGVCLNVNFPDVEKINGVKICKQDDGNWYQEWETCSRKDGSRHYWLSGYYESSEPNNSCSDRWALLHGYVAITPTVVDLTAYQFVDLLRDWIKE